MDFFSADTWTVIGTVIGGVAGVASVVVAIYFGLRPSKSNGSIKQGGGNHSHKVAVAGHHITVSVGTSKDLEELSQRVTRLEIELALQKQLGKLDAAKQKELELMQALLADSQALNKKLNEENKALAAKAEQQTGTQRQVLTALVNEGFSQAEVLLKQALEKGKTLSPQAQDQEEKGWAEVDYSLGQRARTLGQYEKALDYFTLAAKAEPSNRSYIEAIDQILDAMNRYAGSAQRSARTLAPAGREGDLIRIATTSNNLVPLHKFQIDFKEIEPTYHWAIATAEQSLTADQVDMVKRLNQSAALYSSLGRDEEAERSYREVIDILKESLPEDHPFLASGYYQLASFYESRSRYEDAKYHLTNAIDILKKSQSADHLPFLASSYNNLAFLYESQRFYAQAERLYREAIAILEKSLPADHFNTKVAKANYERMKAAQQRTLSAEP